MLDELQEHCRRPSMPPEIQKLGRTIRNWFDKICNLHLARVSNGPTEAINNLIKRIKRVGFGFRNFENSESSPALRRQTELASARLDRGPMKLTPPESDEPSNVRDDPRENTSAAGGIRTPDPRFRRPML